MSQGLVNIDAEIEKCKKKQALAQNGAEKLETSMSAGDYETKLPLQIREKNAEKVRGHYIRNNEKKDDADECVLARWPEG